MGKVKIKRKSTLIDMTAMSDVTVLLLTFFMLTSTFLAKEPTVVMTPSSVSEEKVPMNNLVTILVSGKDKPGNEGNPATEGKIFISFTGDKDSTLSSEHIREMMLLEAVKIYNEQHPSAKVELNSAQIAEFTKLNMFGLPFRGMPQYLSLEQSKRDEFQGNMEDPNVGIPIDGNKDRNGKLNDFQVWMKAVYNVAQRIHNDQKDMLTDPADVKKLENLYTALMRKGEGIAVKADKNTPYSTVQIVFDNLQTMKLNKFSLLTALKSEDEPTH
ncbi:MAG: biopolymer transporter ExbD [Muribaculaceae bacterium]|nr:biopolymer transporter ExbD [Muribaculaceae bacterium]MBR5550890.1 biopolymer transporter ExbD [Muribaculaceae bacterium]